MSGRLVVEHDVPVPMRDGTVLRANVHLPASTAPLPVIVQRNPYDKNAPHPGVPLDATRFVRAGYAFVLQDVRGRFASEGDFTPFVNEAADGEDTLAWAATQPWSNGRVGMVGGSYNGATQLLAASRRPPSLLAIAPRMTTADYHEGWTYRGGVQELGFTLYWTLSSLVLADLGRRGGDASVQRDRERLIEAIDGLTTSTYRRLSPDQVELLDAYAPYYRRWLAHPTYDDYWRAVAARERFAEMDVPALHVGGWFDIFLTGTLTTYQGLRRSARSASARACQRLLVGPWSHAVTGGTFRELDFGLRSGFDVVDVTGVHLRWLDHWLRGAANGIDRDAPVRIFVMGDRVWRDEADWPPPDVDYRRLHLRSGGRAAGPAGAGVLSWEAPPPAEPSDTFEYDPDRPVPTLGGATLLAGQSAGANVGPRDQRPVLHRPDVLCYTSEPLEARLEVTGPIELRLFVSSSAPDTDFVARFIDVHPSGLSMLLTEGILRARYRDRGSAQAPLWPGGSYELGIDLGATSNAFLPGHRLRLLVTSSSFPRFDPNPNTWAGRALDGEAEAQTALNTVHHDAARPSHLTLPVVERGG